MSLLKIKTAARPNCNDLFNILCTYLCKASTFPKLFHSTNLHHKRIVRSPTQIGCLWSISFCLLICHVTELGSYILIFHVSLFSCSKYVWFSINHCFCFVRKYSCPLPKKSCLLNQGQSLSSY